MKVYLLIILFFNYITCLDIPGTFSYFDLLSSYMTPKNDMLVYIKNSSSLYKYYYNSKMPFYTNRVLLKTKEFPKNETIEDIYFNFRHLNYSTINITYFNENYASYYIYNADIENNMSCGHISLKVIEKNKLILFLYPKNYTIQNYSTINIVEFDSKSKEKLKVKKQYFFKALSLDAIANCVNTVGDNIICGLIEYGKNGTKAFEFSLMYFSESEQSPTRVSIINQTNYYTYIRHATDLDFLFYFMKLFLLSKEKIIFCYNVDDNYNSKIKCGFAQDKNNTMIINNPFDLTKETTKEKDFEYIKRNAFNGVKISDTQIIFSFFNYGKKYIEYFNITLNNNMIHNIEPSYDSSVSLTGVYLLNLLKNNDDNLVSIIVGYSKAQFKEYGYTTCKDSYNYLYNGEQKLLSFNNINSLFKTGSENTVIFLNNNQKLYSIIDTASNKQINYLVKYDKSRIKYIYNSNDYYNIKNNRMRLQFTSGLNEKKHQTCELILSFNRCSRTECEICKSYYDCYDRYWNTIAPPKEPINVNVNTTDFQKYFFILPLSILAMLIVLIFFTFAKCCVKEPLPNYGGNLIQNEMPLIQS